MRNALWLCEAAREARTSRESGGSHWEVLMSKQLQRYFTALLACVIASTWVAAGFGPALAGLAAATVANAAVAFAQRRGGRDVERRSASTRRPTKPARGRPPANAWPAFDTDAELAGEQAAGPVPATGRYGW